MSKGICLFAQKNEKSDYYKQAVACAMSIKAFNPKEQICLITDMKVKTEHEKYFDVTKDIPGNDLSLAATFLFHSIKIGFTVKSAQKQGMFRLYAT